MTASDRGSSPMVLVEDLHLTFGAQRVLRGISLVVPRGGILAIIGPSGSGKSTLLRCVNLLATPDRGSIRIGDASASFGRADSHPLSDRALAAFRANAGMVFQHFNLFPHRTVLENVMEGPLIVRKRPRAEAEAVARRLLSKVGLADKHAAYPSRLSGGEKQRVAIARALAIEPAVMLFDEATSALDPELVGEVLAVIRALAQDGMTMLIVTHEIAFARQVADRILFMRDGVIVEEGAAKQVIDDPREEATMAFLSHFRAGERL